MVHPVDLEEFAHYLRAESVAGTAGGEGEFVAFWVWVGPDEVGHGAFVGDFAEAVNDFDLVDRVDGRGETYIYVCIAESATYLGTSVSQNMV